MIKYTLIICLILASSGGVLGTGRLVAESMSVNKALPPLSRTQIKIVAAPEIALAGQAVNGDYQTQFLECQAAGPIVFAQVQNQTVINLHQPASCFSWTIKQDLNPQIELTVKPLYRTKHQVVVLPLTRLKSVNYHPAGPVQPVNAQVPMPMPVVLMVLMIVTLNVTAEKFKNLSLRQIKHSLTLERLMIMRC